MDEALLRLVSRIVCELEHRFVQSLGLSRDLLLVERRVPQDAIYRARGESDTSPVTTLLIFFVWKLVTVLGETTAIGRQIPPDMVVYRREDRNRLAISPIGAASPPSPHEVMPNADGLFRCSGKTKDRIRQ